MVNRIKALCKERKTNFSAVEKALGLANASLAKTNEKTQSCRLKAIADYFDVSMEYLLTGKEMPREPLKKDERELLCLFRALSSEGRLEALGRIGEMASMDKWTRETGKPESSAS